MIVDSLASIGFGSNPLQDRADCSSSTTVSLKFYNSIFQVLQLYLSSSTTLSLKFYNCISWTTFHQTNLLFFLRHSFFLFCLLFEVVVNFVEVTLLQISDFSLFLCSHNLQCKAKDNIVINILSLHIIMSTKI